MRIFDSAAEGTGGAWDAGVTSTGARIGSGVGGSAPGGGGSSSGPFFNETDWDVIICCDVIGAGANFWAGGGWGEATGGEVCPAPACTGAAPGLGATFLTRRENLS